MVDFNLAFFSSSENVTVKTLLKSVYTYQSHCKKNLAQFFLAHPVYIRYIVYIAIGACDKTWGSLTSCDFKNLWSFVLKIGTPVIHGITNVKANFGFSRTSYSRVP